MWSCRLKRGMTYTPGDAVGIVPENRQVVVDEMLGALGFTGSERVLDHYKVEISLDEALRDAAGDWGAGAGDGSRRC